MIIDIINLAGDKSYFKDSSGNINLSASVPSSAVTSALGKRTQMNVNGIVFYIKGTDLLPLVDIMEDDGSGTLIKRAAPIVEVYVTKEMFPGLFADPFRSRVHTIAGFEDFKKGTFENCDVYRINNKPVLVSIGTGQCKWKSAKYEMPEDTSFLNAYWDIASSKDTPVNAFKYSITLNCFKADGTALPPVQLASNLDPSKPRIASLNLNSVRFYEIEFTADVFHDSNITERILSEKGDTIGRPLLDSLHLLEPVPGKYDFNSLHELVAECSDYNMFELQGLPFTTMTATLNLSAVLIQSDNENINSGQFEKIEIRLKTDKFDVFTAKLTSEILLKSPL